MGIEEAGMPPVEHGAPLRDLCSTPVGIEEAGIQSPAYKLIEALVCSTPVGIEEAGIRSACDLASVDLVVLNARGHRRGGHNLAAAC